MEPPPAPTVSTATIGIRMGWPPTDPSVVRSTWPSRTSETSQEVPPKSKVTRPSASGVRRPTRPRRPPPARRGPSSRRPRGPSRRRRCRRLPASRADSVALARSPLVEPCEVVVDDRRHRRVGDGRRDPLVLPECREHLVTRRDCRVEFLVENFGRAPFIMRVSVGVEERDGDRLDVAAFADLVGDGPNLVLVDWSLDAVDRRALVDLEPALGRGPAGLACARPGRRAPGGPGDRFRDVAEARCGDERRLCAGALQERVDGGRRRVTEPTDVGGVDVGRLAGAVSIPARRRRAGRPWSAPSPSSGPRRRATRRR